MSSEETNEIDEAELDVSRRLFLHRSIGAVAGLAGLLGLGSAAGLLGDSGKRSAGYGSSPYGGSKEG